MKIVVIFGDDNVASRERYFKIIDGIKKRGWEHVPLRSEAKGGIAEQLVSTSLFPVETLYSLDSAAKVTIKEYEWINKHNEEHEGSLLLYFSNTIPAAIKKLLPKSTKFEEFKLKKELFSFLDTVYPGNKKRAVSLFQEIIKTDAPELVLALLARQMRDLAWIKSGETLNLPDWRKRKLASQADKFKENSLNEFIQALAKADVDSKTGRGELVTLLDIALIRYL